MGNSIRRQMVAAVLVLSSTASCTPPTGLAPDPASTSTSSHTPSKSGEMKLAKRDIFCTPVGSVELQPMGAILEEPGLEILDDSAVKRSSIVNLGPQGYVITAGTMAFSTGLSKGRGDVMLAGLDSNFNPLWATVIGGPTADIPSSAARTADGGFAVVAQTKTQLTLFKQTDVVLLSKYAADGSLEWAQYHTPGEDAGLKAVVAPTSGGIVFGGWAWRKRWAGFLIRLDDRGNLQWAREVGRDYENSISWIEKGANGGLLLAGPRRVEKASKFEVWLAKISDSGDVGWAKAYKLENGASPVFASATAKGGFVVVRAPSSGGQPPRTKIPVFEVDADGNVLWAEEYEFSESVRVSDVAESRSGHLLLFGNAYRDDKNAGPFTLEIDRSGRIVTSTAVDLVRSATTAERSTLVVPGPVSVSRDETDGFVIMGEMFSVPTHMLPQPKSFKPRSVSDLIQSEMSLPLYFVRVDESGRAGACSRPVETSQRSIKVKGVDFELPMRELPAKNTTFIPKADLTIERIIRK